MEVKFKELSYDYEPEEMFLDLSKPLAREDAIKTLFLVHEICEENQILIALAFGTLLGALREKDFIKGDFDIDVYTENEDGLFYNLAKMEEKGLALVRAIPGEVYSFRYSSNCYIDIYILKKVKQFPWSFWCSSISNCYEPQKLFQGYDQISFLGRLFYCPKNPLAAIQWWYGKDWIKPADKNNYYSHYEVFSHEIIKSPQKAIKWLFRKIVGNKIYYLLKGLFHKM